MVSSHWTEKHRKWTTQYNHQTHWIYGQYMAVDYRCTLSKWRCVFVFAQCNAKTTTVCIVYNNCRSHHVYHLQCRNLLDRRYRDGHTATYCSLFLPTREYHLAIWNNMDCTCIVRVHGCYGHPCIYFSSALFLVQGGYVLPVVCLFVWLLATLRKSYWLDICENFTADVSFPLNFGGSPSSPHSALQKLFVFF